MKEAHIWVYPVENTEYKDKGEGKTHFPSSQNKKRIIEIKLTLDLFSGSDTGPVRLECQGVLFFFKFRYIHAYLGWESETLEVLLIYKKKCTNHL